MVTAWLLSGGVWLVLAGCKSQPGPDLPTAADPLECKGRTAGYVATGGFAGAEVGVAMDCQQGPQIRTWRILGEDGKSTTANSMTADEFNQAWERIEAAGWRNLSDCPAPGDGQDAAEPDESATVYRIGIRDETHSVSLTCVGKELPFPYNRVVDSLDVTAAAHSR